MTPQTGSLWNLGGTLFELLEAREEAANASTSHCDRVQTCDVEDCADCAEAKSELAAIEHGITLFVAQQLRDVDGLRAPLKALEQGVTLNKADAAAATNRAMILQNRYDRLKDLIKQCMVALDQAGEWKPKESRKFESARGSFTLRGNGGAQPVEIHDESLVPDEMWRVIVTMPLDLWMEVNHDVKPDTLARMCKEVTQKNEVSKSAVAETLAKPCLVCRGEGSVDITDAGMSPCTACGETGKAGVPGARLAPRGESVIVK